MIPRIIHYCWFGRKPKSGLYRRCIASWYRLCPDYRIVEWNEDNFDCGQHPYLKWCYDHGKWAFLSDFARLLILKEHGGIYLDTDVELIKPLGTLLEYDAFLGFENETWIATGLGIGCVPDHPVADALLQPYLQMKPAEDGSYKLTSCPRLNTEALLPYGLKQDGTRQQVCGAEILPAEYLNPYDDPTGRLNKTENTFSIHWFGKSWMSKKTILRSRLTRPIHRLFGVDALKRFRNRKM
jgi:hypothetical protein